MTDKEISRITAQVNALAVGRTYKSSDYRCEHRARACTSHLPVFGAIDAPMFMEVCTFIDAACGNDNDS